MKKSYLISLVVIVTLAVVALGTVVQLRYSPKLGLDLQGGASVVLQPTRPVSKTILNETISIIRNRVDALGVAEPTIGQQGKNIVVELPGVKDSKRALKVVGQTAQLLFRPVIQTLPPVTTTPSKSTSTTKQIPTTSRSQDLPNKTVVLPQIQNGKVVARYMLAPAQLTGRVVKSAQAVFDPTTSTWSVNLILNSSGSAAFDSMAAKNYQKQVAIVLDGVVKSAPVINAKHFNGTPSISGNFTQKQAQDLAVILRFGALPVQLKPLTVQTVSATLGKSSLRAGLYAGIGGLLLVLVYMIFYYRALGIVVVFGLCLSGAFLYSIISWLGHQSGLALSLSGVTGIIVSIGVTVDSYVVYFERLKDEIRGGKTVRSSVDRGFSRAYRTILAADAVSFIAALLLYWLSIGAVRGFAFTLGLSTLLDVITAYFFTRPVVVLLGRSRTFTEARWLGVGRGLAMKTTSK